MLTRYEKTVGRWPTALEILIAHDLDLAVHFVNLASAGQGEALSPKVKALVSIAANGACTYFDGEALQHHMQAALFHGASPDEIIEVLELTSVPGIHSSITGFPILADELENCGSPLTPHLPSRQDEEIGRAQV